MILTLFMNIDKYMHRSLLIQQRMDIHQVDNELKLSQREELPRLFLLYSLNKIGRELYHYQMDIALQNTNRIVHHLRHDSPVQEETVDAAATSTFSLHPT